MQNIDIQDVFNKVICKGHYGGKYGSKLMCHALKSGFQNGVITEDEYAFAISEIRGYIGGFGSLGGFLHFKGNDWSFETRLDIYINWLDRPKFN